MALKMLSLFSSIGGTDLAAAWAGVETVAFCEIDSFCQKVLRKHWSNVPIWNNIYTLNREGLWYRNGVGGVDIVAGGYPCQPFSMAGKRKGAEDHRCLWPELFRIISELRPTWVIGENVAGHVTLELDDVLANLESAGYSARPFIIPAAGVGAPHRRERVFTVAWNSNGGNGNQRLFEKVARRKNSESERICVDVVDSQSKFTGRLPSGTIKAVTGFIGCDENVADSTSERCGEARHIADDQHHKRGIFELVNNLVGAIPIDQRT